MEAAPGTPRSRALKDITFGSIAGMAAKVFEHPFDLTKVRLQSQVLDAQARFTGPLDCLVKTWKGEGIRGLYRGLPAPIVGAMAENASLFMAYSEMQILIRRFSGQSPSEALSLSQLALAGAAAGAATSFVLTPIELVKCKMQVQMLAPGIAAHATVLPATGAAALHTTRPALPGPFTIVANTVRTFGLRGLWLGHTGTFIRETGGGAAWFFAKEAAASALRTRRHAGPLDDLAPWESAVGGACAGVAYNVALFPADTIKSTIQTSGELRPGARSVSFVGTARELWRSGGLRGLYAGCGVTVARAIPSSALIFLIYDGLTQRFA